LAGLASGFVLAVLIAPRPGAATRKLIGRKVRVGEDWVEEQAGAVKEWVVTQGADLRDRVSSVAEAITRS